MQTRPPLKSSIINVQPKSAVSGLMHDISTPKAPQAVKKKDKLLQLSDDNIFHLSVISRESFHVLPKTIHLLNQLKEKEAIDHIIFLQEVTRCYASHCESLQMLYPTTFVSNHARHLIEITNHTNDYLCDDNMDDEQSAEIRDYISTVHTAIIKMSLEVLPQSAITLQTRIKALECIEDLCFNEASDYVSSVEMREVGFALYMMAYHASAQLKEHPADDLSYLINLANLIIIKIEKSEVDNHVTTSIESCRRYLSKIKAAMNDKNHSHPASSPQSLFTPQPPRHSLSTITHVFYDFDETLMSQVNLGSGNTRCYIKPGVVSLLPIIHNTLGIKATIITSRNAEIEHSPSYFQKKNQNKTETFHKVNNLSPLHQNYKIDKILSEHGLNHIFPRDSIVFCNFRDKKSFVKKNVTLFQSQPQIYFDDDKLSSYFEITAESKTSKVPDYLNICRQSGTSTQTTAIFDDQKGQWNDLGNLTPHFFCINNADREKSLENYLLFIVTQLILHGEHLEKENRLQAAKELTQLFDKENKKMMVSCLHKFIGQNEKDSTLERNERPLSRHGH